MQNFTAENAYQLYHREQIYSTKKIYPRPIKDFTKQKAKDSWNYFEHFAKLVVQSGGTIDPSIYVKAIFTFFEGEYVNPMLLPSQKGIRIYRDYCEALRNNVSLDQIYIDVRSSIKFVAEFCVENDLTSLDQYLSNNISFPTVLRHFKAGSISGHFLSLHSGFKYLLGITYPTDVVSEMCPNLRKELSGLRSVAIRHPKLRTIASNFEQIINTVIKGALDARNKNISET